MWNGPWATKPMDGYMTESVMHSQYSYHPSQTALPVPVGQNSFTALLRVGRWVGLGGWLCRNDKARRQKTILSWRQEFSSDFLTLSVGQLKRKWPVKTHFNYLHRFIFVGQPWAQPEDRVENHRLAKLTLLWSIYWPLGEEMPNT